MNVMKEAFLNTTPSQYGKIRLEGRILNEEKLSRVWQTTTKEGKVFAIITAFRGNYSMKKNLRILNNLKSDLNNLAKDGFGYWSLAGVWVSGSGQKEEEISLFVSQDSKKVGDGKYFRSIMTSLCQKYKQDSIVLRDDPNQVEIKLYAPQESSYDDNIEEDKSISEAEEGEFVPKLTGTSQINQEFSIGKFNTVGPEDDFEKNSSEQISNIKNSIQNGYSKLDNNRTFVFESVLDYKTLGVAGKRVKKYNENRILD